MKGGCAQASMIGLPEIVVKVRSPFNNGTIQSGRFLAKEPERPHPKFSLRKLPGGKAPIILAPFTHDTKHPCLFHYYARNQEEKEGSQLRCCQLTGTMQRSRDTPRLVEQGCFRSLRRWLVRGSIWPSRWVLAGQHPKDAHAVD